MVELKVVGPQEGFLLLAVCVIVIDRKVISVFVVNVSVVTVNVPSPVPVVVSEDVPSK